LRAVGVGAVFEGDDLDAVVAVVDAVDDPVVAAAGAVQSGQVELEGFADSPGVGGQ
jgi:hypothetical protein